MIAPAEDDGHFPVFIAVSLVAFVGVLRLAMRRRPADGERSTRSITEAVEARPTPVGRQRGRDAAEGGTCTT